jgi:hypothetical protein
MQYNRIFNPMLKVLYNPQKRTLWSNHSYQVIFLSNQKLNCWTQIIEEYYKNQIALFFQRLDPQLDLAIKL